MVATIQLTPCLVLWSIFGPRKGDTGIGRQKHIRSPGWVSSDASQSLGPEKTE